MFVRIAVKGSIWSLEPPLKEDLIFFSDLLVSSLSRDKVRKGQPKTVKFQMSLGTTASWVAKPGNQRTNIQAQVPV